MSRLIRRVPADFHHRGPWPFDTRGEPPTGDAWQVWEDVSEGSPISPVFTIRDSLVAWLVENEDCAPAAADAFIDHGWAPSMLVGPFGAFTGVQVAAGEAAAIEWLYASEGLEFVPAGTPIRHLESGISGKVNHRFAPPNSDYYYVTWDRGVPSLLAEYPEIDPDAPMDAGCRFDAFEVMAEAVTT